MIGQNQDRHGFTCKTQWYMNIEFRTTIKYHDMTCNHDKLYKSLNGCPVCGPFMELASPLASRHHTGKVTDLISQHALSLSVANLA